LGASWRAGDEIIVTQQDHEANIGVWRRKAEQQGATIREWAIDPDTGLLNPDDLYAMLNENTRWLFFTQCSNLMGTINPVAQIVSKVRALCQARVCVDAVAYAPHHICDLKALDVDIYLFSLYKVFGPHQGMLYVKQSLTGELQGQGHYFNREENSKRYNPAGPQHAQIAACLGVLDYLEALHRHHGGQSNDTVRSTMDGVHQLIMAHETQLATPLLSYLDNSALARLLGKSHCEDGDRAPTIAFKPLQKSSAEVTAAMQADGIGTEHGDFYAPRALQHMGLDPVDGVVRLSLVHYNTQAEVDRILSALDRAL
jgi:selenocysteine lyase/cysteine desulfurase